MESYQGCVEVEEIKYDAFCTLGDRDDQTATHAKLLNIKYEFYGFSGDPIETTN